MPIVHLVRKYRSFVVMGIGIIAIFSGTTLSYYTSLRSETQILSIAREKSALTQKFLQVEREYTALKNQDQVLLNQKNQEEIKNIHNTYTNTFSSYEKLQDLKLKLKDTKQYDVQFALILKQLADRNYSSASSTLQTLEKSLKQEGDKLASSTQTSTTAPSAQAIANAPVSNTAPGSGYSRQRVKSEIGEFTVDIIAADLGSTRVIVDTASDGDCRDNCPVLSLGDYAARNGAFAGVNGSYFCPASYPTCAGKTNSFDTLLMNKNKKYFNADNNVYSTVPVAIFGNGWVKFLGRSLDWGRDTSVDGVIANQPLVLSGGNIAFGGDGDPKKGGEGSRSFVGNKGNTAYIGVVHNATVAEVGYALKALGLENGLNLDSGGSTALWYGGYKAGPGRNIPNAILFVRK